MGRAIRHPFRQGEGGLSSRVCALEDNRANQRGGLRQSRHAPMGRFWGAPSIGVNVVLFLYVRCLRRWRLARAAIDWRLYLAFGTHRACYRLVAVNRRTVTSAPTSIVMRSSPNSTGPA